MLSKCANPECVEIFRYLHQGRIFRLSPTPTVQSTAAALGSQLTERFWLCNGCAEIMTVVWDGKRANIAPLPATTEAFPVLPPPKGPQRVGSDVQRRRAAAAGRDDH